MMRIALHRWPQQLAAMLHFGAIAASHGEADAAIFEIEDDRAALLLRKRGEITRVGTAKADEKGFQKLGRALADNGGSPGFLILRVASGAALQKRMSVPISARQHLEGLLGFEMDRETPYARDEVYWDYAIRRQDRVNNRLDVDLVVVPRSVVDPLMGAARSAGLDFNGIEIAGGANKAPLIRLGERGRWQWLRSQRPLAAMAGVAGILAIGAIATPFIRQQQAIAEAVAAVAALTSDAQEAAKLRQTVDQFANTSAYLRQERERTGSALEALAATTRALPDDTYLTSFNLRENRLTITGLSPSAAQLVGALAQSKDFREPDFDSPVLQNDNDGLETFTISITLKPAGAS